MDRKRRSITLYKKVDDIPLADIFLVVSLNEGVNKRPTAKIIASYPTDLTLKLEGINLVMLGMEYVDVYMFSRTNNQGWNQYNNSHLNTLLWIKKICC